MIKVTPRQKESLPSLIKRFRKLCEREGIMKDIRRTEAYEKPSEKRRRKNRRKPVNNDSPKNTKDKNRLMD